MIFSHLGELHRGLVFLFGGYHPRPTLALDFGCLAMTRIKKNSTIISRAHWLMQRDLKILVPQRLTLLRFDHT